MTAGDKETAQRALNRRRSVAIRVMPKGDPSEPVADGDWDKFGWYSGGES